MADGGHTIMSRFCGICGSTLFLDQATFVGLKVAKVGVMKDIDRLGEVESGMELLALKRVA
ncbi:hypothetical protein MMC18_007838 [Xylographa bjoerkii]|nr:hypothetical protein [Xylographa bjoerkii]